MDAKTKEIHFRVSQEEYDYYKKLSKKFNNKISHLMRRSVAQFDAHYSVDKLKIQEEYCKYWQDHDREMRRMTGNLNQAMKRVNELAKAGHLRGEDAKIILEEVQNVKETVFTYVEKLEQFSNKILG